ncbi:MAG: hypothetical protein ACC657_16475 [Thiohalomonadales bacterium]
MTKTLIMLLISGIAISSSNVWAAGSGSRNDGSTRIVNAAAARPNAVQAGGSAIASRPAAQAGMDAAMAANPNADALMRDVQKAGGYTPPAK